MGDRGGRPLNQRNSLRIGTASRSGRMPSLAAAPRRGGNIFRSGSGVSWMQLALPLAGVGVLVALFAFVIVPGIGGLFAPSTEGKNLTNTPTGEQTVKSLPNPAKQLSGGMNDIATRVFEQASNPPRFLNLGTTDTGMGKVTFSAVGDNLYNENLLEIADANAGEVGDGEYAFDSFYRKIAKTIKGFDISFINQETTLGGPDRFGYNGYPSYNTPDSLAQVVADTGWDVVNTNSNHTYDTWVPSIEHAQGVWNGLRSQLLTIGSFTSEEDRSAPRVVSCNGLSIAFLSYSYGQNGYEQSDLPNDFYAVPYDAEKMEAEVAAAHKIADAVVVYLHGGTEYEHEPSETQRIWAQECADAGADLIIGSHVHVIQSMEWLKAADGEKTLAVYGLGDFLAGYHNYPETIMSGMFSCTFERVDGSGAEGEDGKESKRKVRVTDVVWTPLIEHWENGDSYVRKVKGYTKKEAEANELLNELEDPLGWIKDTTKKVIGEDFKIDM